MVDYHLNCVKVGRQSYVDLSDYTHSGDKKESENEEEQLERIQKRALERYEKETGKKGELTKN